jgi:hypothetical protein
MQKHWSILTVVALFAGGAAAEATAASPFDGVYHGTQRTIRGATYTDCQHIDSNNIVLQIQNGQFTRQWGSANLAVTVAPNGSFDATGMMTTGGRQAVRAAELKGQITGNKLEADIGTPYCAGHLSLTKS